MIKYKFCFYDVINSIEFLCDNEFILEQYIHEIIFTNYSDNELFRAFPFDYNNFLIKKNLNYNYAILDFINNSNIKKVIHTMGNNRINQELIAQPVNQNLGFNPYINGLLDSCNINQIQFVPISYSPSQIAVNRGGQIYRDNLDNWILENVLNN